MCQETVLAAMKQGEMVTTAILAERIGTRKDQVGDDLQQLLKHKLVEVAGKQGRWKLWKRI